MSRYAYLDKFLCNNTVGRDPVLLQHTRSVLRKSDIDRIQELAKMFPAFHSLALPDGTVRKYVRLRGLVKSGTQRGTFIAAYDDGLLMLGVYSHGSVPLVLSTCEKPEDEGWNIKAHTIASTQVAELPTNHWEPGEDEILELETLRQLRDDGVLDRLGDVVWGLHNTAHDRDDRVDFGELFGRAKAPRFALEIPVKVPLPSGFTSQPTTGQNQVQLSMLQFLAYRNALRQERTGARVYHVGEPLKPEDDGEGRVLGAYLGELLASPKCPDDWQERSCEAWYEHVSEFLAGKLQPVPGDAPEDMYLSSPEIKGVFLAQGQTRAYDMHYHANRTLKKKCSLETVIGALGPAYVGTMDVVAAIPHDTLMRMRMEDFVRLHPYPNIGMKWEISGLGSEVEKLLPKADVLDDDPKSARRLLSELSSDQLWNFRPWGTVMQRGILNGA